MVLERKRLGEFHARMKKVQSDLYRAEYSGEINPKNPDEREIPDCHVSTSVADAKVWVEQMALGLGYDHVVWDELPDV